MLMVDAYAQNYRWSMAEILALTMPQIVMINAASDVSRRRLDARMAARKDRRSPSSSYYPTSAPSTKTMPMFNGKPIDQLTSAEYLLYHRMTDD